MEWETILIPYRLGCPKEESACSPDRTNFQRDFDRIIFSPAFRRLNGKTQVFPFPETDIIHTRLTHSLEAASVGRSLGTIVGNKLHEKYNNDNILGCDLGAIVSAACLAHDIGNPPLGHSGESAISEYFQSDSGSIILDGLSSEEKMEFKDFEGNAMGFHILAHSNLKKTTVQGGLGLTYPTLASFIKYPRTSSVTKDENAISEKKPGLFLCDLPSYNEIKETLEIPSKPGEENKWCRHPLAFLTEAADDICYYIMDLEDGYKHGMVAYEEVENLFMQICDVFDKSYLENVSKIISQREKIGYLRAKAINSLIYQISDVFLEKEEQILNNSFDLQFCTLIDSKDTIKQISDISVQKIYSHKPVLQIEAAGFKVLPGLLETLLYALKYPDKKGSKKIMQLIPDEYLDFKQQQYESIMSITTYIAGMTDTFAVDTFRNLQGIQLPNH